MSATASIPSSVVLPEDLPATATCAFCEVEMDANKDNFFPHRASGGLHLNKCRCRKCDKAYRTELKNNTDAGNHVAKPRGSHKARIAAENQAAAARAEVLYLGSPAHEYSGYVPAVTVAATPTNRRRRHA